MSMSSVKASRTTIVLPTYLPAAPDKNPMFLEKRVYQGSSGKVYPLPFTDRIAEKPVDRKWQALWIENEFLRVLVLPELGGRIHAIQDKTNGYDLIYNQHVIKPALVGLAGPWASGGIEFNWPQHHRPATFLPVDSEIEEHADGSKTVWCCDHDPMNRLNGLHGVCLYPGRACLELKVRAYNRTPYVQTFLWWANVATRVHEAYQSFFPPDVYYVADHARRSMSGYPLAEGSYYGVNYGARGRQGIPPNEIPSQFIPPHCLTQSAIGHRPSAIPNYAPNDLSFYANIPVPTSYMCMGSKQDFMGGYDYAAEAGLIHVANHHISPGKKQWTWGNQDFGYAWDRNLTEKDGKAEFGPYIEIMAGVYTDNQPDFSFLQPGETKSWSQFWYPIQKIGPAQNANLSAAVSLRLRPGPAKAGTPNLELGVSVTRNFPRAKIVLVAKNKKLFGKTCDLAPGRSFVAQVKLPRGIPKTDLRFSVTDSAGDEIISYQPKPLVKGDVPPPATEPLPPEKISSADELFITGLHLDQYRHATRSPADYWREALRRDPLDVRCNNGMGLWHFKRGEFDEAETCFRRAIERLTRRNANPYDGEAYYNLGICLRSQLDAHPPHSSQWSHLFDAAYAALYKATWNQAWAAASYHALAELDCTQQKWAAALEHLDRSLRLDTDNLRARDLKVMVLRLLNRGDEAKALVQANLALNPLDWWAKMLNGGSLDCDAQLKLDIAHDLARAGFHAQAIAALEIPTARDGDLPTQTLGTAPLVEYTLGWLFEKSGDTQSAMKHFRRAAALPPDYCFPSRLEDIAVLKSAMRANSRDARAPYYLGNLFYDRRRHDEAIRLWELSAKHDPEFSIVWRNLGIGYFNIHHRPKRARAAYDRAVKVNPHDARLLFERDQLWKRLGDKPARRLRELEKHPQLVQLRDDLSVEWCSLLNQTGRHAEAMEYLARRNFQPWEGGEGGPLGLHIRTHLALGREALARNDYSGAVRHFENALKSPPNLGEAKHLLANQSNVNYWLGVALNLTRQKKAAREQWLAAANCKGDFVEMSVRPFSEKNFYSALASQRLGRGATARRLLRDLLVYAETLQNTKANIEYFATSLPTMLLFDDDLQFRQETAALFMQAQARLGLGDTARAKALLSAVLKRDPNHPLAADFAHEIQTGYC
jgi:tetratricopeptide (TPR) repeat protein